MLKAVLGLPPNLWASEDPCTPPPSLSQDSMSHHHGPRHDSCILPPALLRPLPCIFSFGFWFGGWCPNTLELLQMTSAPHVLDSTNLGTTAKWTSGWGVMGLLWGAAQQRLGVRQETARTVSQTEEDTKAGVDWFLNRGSSSGAISVGPAILNRVSFPQHRCYNCATGRQRARGSAITWKATASKGKDSHIWWPRNSTSRYKPWRNTCIFAPGYTY